MTCFYPARLNLSLVKLLQNLAPWLIRWQRQIELVVGTEPQVDLAKLQNAPCLLLCNHPTFDDPLVMFLFSGVVQRPFYYLAAHERFAGLEGWLFQQIGAYSIRRGQADRESVAYTLKLLDQPDCKLVIFPEGGCSFQNDTVMPFRPGAVQMALQALAKRQRRESREAEERRSRGAEAPFYVVPISLKYRYKGNVTPLIEQSLRRLEKAVNVQKQGDFYGRLRRVAAAVISQIERQHGVEVNAEADWNQRILGLKQQILEQCEWRLQLTPAPNEANRERVYRIQHALQNRYSLSSLNSTKQNTTAGETADAEVDEWTADASQTSDAWATDEWEVMRKSLSRLLNFDAIYDGYVAERPTPERFLDTLTRLEREVFDIDQPLPKGQRQAFLRVGQPVNLIKYLPQYAQDRTATVKAVTQLLQQQVQHNLDVLSEATARGISW